MNKRNYIIALLYLSLYGCNGYTSKQYYDNFSQDKLSKSLEEEYKDKYAKKWKSYSIEDIINREDYINLNEYYKLKTSSWDLDNKNRKSKKYCVYSLSYFLPLNFWNIRFSNKQYIRKTLKDLSKENQLNKNLKYIKIDSHGFGSPIFSFFCKKISGKIN